MYTSEEGTEERSRLLDEALPSGFNGWSADVQNTYLILKMTPEQLEAHKASAISKMTPDAQAAAYRQNQQQTGSNILYTSFLELQKLLALYFSADSPPPTGSGPSEHTQQFQPQSSVFFISPLSLFRPHGAGTSSSFAPSQQSSQTSHPHTSVELMTRSCHEKKTE